MKTSYLSGSISIDTTVVKHLLTIIKLLSGKYNSNVLNGNLFNMLFLYLFHKKYSFHSICVYNCFFLNKPYQIRATASKLQLSDNQHMLNLVFV